MIMLSGREREALELELLEKARRVGILMKMEQFDWGIVPAWDDFAQMPRRELKARVKQLRPIIRQFCRLFFPGATPESLAWLYDQVLQNSGSYSLPRLEFEEKVGGLSRRVARDTPLHAAVMVSATFGLQFQFPEDHMCKDWAVAYNRFLEFDEVWSRLRDARLRDVTVREHLEIIGAVSRVRDFYARATILTGFNLVETFINGLAWECVHTKGSHLKPKQCDELSERTGFVSIGKKLVRYPRIIKGSQGGILHDSRDPLRTFLRDVKPLRDAIVHLSPFAKPTGYDKVQQFYGLETDRVSLAVDTCYEIVTTIWKFVKGRKSPPAWLIGRLNDGRFDISLVSIQSSLDDVVEKIIGNR